MRTRIQLLILAGILASGLAFAVRQSPSFEKTDCRFDVPSGVEIRCGDLFVPENRSRDDSPWIRLHVAIIQPENGHPTSDPLVVLNGGPGSPTLAGLDYWLYVFGNVLQKRTLILLDQRGTGYSLPSLNCPEVEEQWKLDWSKKLSLQESDQNDDRALRVCHDRLVAAGVDLSAYNTAADAADVKDLRQALGYSRWNLYGGAYGTRLALAVMQEDPHGVRSVILDSAYPPQVNLYTGRADNFERSIDLLFKRCASASECNHEYPDLRNRFGDLFDQLNRQPKLYTVYNPSTGTFHNLVLNGDRWVWVASQMFYGTGLASTLPKTISTVRTDLNFSFEENLNRIVSLNASLSEGAYYSTQCAEDMPSLTMQSSSQADPEMSAPLLDVLDASRMARDCAAWETARPAPLQKQAVTSDIPTLILAGELDPITPPAWGQLAAKTLSRSQYLEFPGFGHGVLGGGPDSGRCTFQIVTDFIDRPTQKVASGCIESLNLGFLSP